MTAADLAARICAAPGDAMQDERAHAPANPRAAVVLVAITDRAQPGVILTRRPLWLRSHAGQVAFPGGKVEAADASDIAAALREAEEEIGLPVDAARVAGTTAPYLSGSGYRITPVIAVIPPDLSFVADPGEVDEWFEVPAATLFDPANYRMQQVQWRGALRDYAEMDWQGRRIWGVTAGIILNLARALEHDDKKWEPVFVNKSCDNKNSEHDDDSRKRHQAPGSGR